MSRQAYVQRGSYLKEKGQSMVLGRIPRLVTGLTALVLVALAILAVLQTGRTSMLPRDGDSRFVVTNPGLVVARYRTGPANAEPSLSHTSGPQSFRGVAAVRAWDDAVSSASASEFAHFRGVAAVRAAETAPLREAAAVASDYAGLRGVAAVRAWDAAVSSASASDFAHFRGVAAVRAAETAQRPAGPDSRIGVPK